MMMAIIAGKTVFQVRSMGFVIKHDLSGDDIELAEEVPVAVGGQQAAAGRLGQADQNESYSATTVRGSFHGE